MQCFRRQNIVVLLRENRQNVLSQGSGVSAYTGENSVVEICHYSSQVCVQTVVSLADTDLTAVVIVFVATVTAAVQYVALTVYSRS